MTRVLGKVGLGVFVGMLVTCSTAYSFWIAAIFAAGSCLCLLLFKRRSISLVLAAAAFASVYAASYTSLVYEPAAALDGTNVTINGVMTDRASYGTGVTYAVRVESVDGKRQVVPYTLYLYSESDLYIEYYDAVEYDGTVYTTSENPLLAMEDSLKTKSVFLSASADREGALRVVKTGSKNPMKGLRRLRDDFVNAVESYVNSPESAVDVGLAYGDKTNIPNEIYHHFRRAGISHILAVSGLHLSVLVLFVSRLLGHAGLSKRMNFFLSVGFILIFTLLVGATPSVMRAAIMTSSALFASLTDRKQDSYNAMGLAAILLLGISPYSVLNLSFLLSFSATLGLVVLSPTLAEKLYPKLAFLGRLSWPVAQSLSLSVSASLFTIPVSVYAFSELSLIAPVTNLFAVPISTVLLPLVLVLSMVGLFRVPLLADGLGRVVEALTFVLEKIAALCAKFPTLPLGFDYVKPWMWITLLMVLLVVFVLRRRRLLPWVAGCSVLLLLVFQTIHQFSVEDMARMAVLENPYGYSVVLLYQNSCSVIGCGGSRSSGRQVYNYLAAQGVDQIDWIVSTSGSSADANGVVYLMEMMPVGGVVIPEEGTKYADVCAANSTTEIVPLDGTMLLGDYPVKLEVNATEKRPVVLGAFYNLNFVYSTSIDAIDARCGEQKPPLMLVRTADYKETMDFGENYGIILGEDRLILVTPNGLYQNQTDLTEIYCDQQETITIRSDTA